MRVDRSTFAAFVDMLTPFEQPELPFASTHWRFTFNFGPKFGLHGPPSLSEAPEAPPLRSPGGGGGGQYGRQNGEARPRRRRPRAHIVVATTATADADADADRTGLRGSGDDDGNDRYGGRLHTKPGKPSSPSRSSCCRVAGNARPWRVACALRPRRSRACCLWRAQRSHRTRTEGDASCFRPARPRRGCRGTNWQVRRRFHLLPLLSVRPTSASTDARLARQHPPTPTNTLNLNRRGHAHVARAFQRRPGDHEGDDSGCRRGESVGNAVLLRIRLHRVRGGVPRCRAKLTAHRAIEV